MTPLSAWENFYVIVGSSAGALIGLQFVVLTLIASRPIGAGTAQAGHAFATPTIVHFGAVLLLAGMLSAPWQEITPAAILWGLLGFSGIVYAAVVTRRMRRQGAYKPVFEDWLFHVLLPLAAYATLAQRRLRLVLIYAQHCLVLARRPCCCYLSAFTMRGTRSRTTYLTAKRKVRKIFSREFTTNFSKKSRE